MNRATLVIMAAGIGSRYGGDIKQLEKVGPSGEIIMDYSIYDAVEAGFDKVVFIIRKDIEEVFKKIIGSRIEKKIKTEYVFQELDNLPEGFEKPAERSKPWGTGQAVLCCKEVVHEPFLVINADDYYGKESFFKIFNYLTGLKGGQNQYCMAGFVLGNTLSDNGTVTRGVCRVNENWMLTGIEETFQIVRMSNDTKVSQLKGDYAAGRAGNGEEIMLPLTSPVSMNMWGFMPEFFNELESGFIDFLNKLNDENKQKAEYLLPSVVSNMLRENQAVVKVLTTNDKWFGVTYKEDRQAVVDALQKLIDEGQYAESII